MSENGTAEAPLTRKDYETEQDIKWCPGCGDYAILKSVQGVLADSGLPKEQFAFVTGIGCSSRFTYYLDTFGMHSIHGRAPAIASGLKMQNPDLSVWVVTGDGDALSIGGNHLIHALRKNMDLNVLLINNKVYGLTKGQYSPTSDENMITKSSPYGSIDHPFNAASLALGASGSFIARSFDTAGKQLQSVVERAYKHTGASLVEIYQNCNIFNDKTFEMVVDKTQKAERCIFLEHGEPLIFGKESDKGIILDGTTPRIVSLDNVSKDDLWIHDETDLVKAKIIAQFSGLPEDEGFMPHPFGVIYAVDRGTYDNAMHQQLDKVQQGFDKDLDKLIAGDHTYEIE